MKTKYEDHEVEVMCRNCGYDLTAKDANKNDCPDCKQTLELQQNVTVSVSLPPLFGDSM